MAKHRASKSASKDTKSKKKKSAPPPAISTKASTEIERDEKGKFVPGKSANPDMVWKPGQSGNPSGRPKTLTPLLYKRLLQTIQRGKNKQTWADKFIESILDRAIDSSDVLAKEILDRIDGKLRPEPDEEIAAAQAGVKVIILDAPRPHRPVIPALPANQVAKGDE